MNAHTGPVGGSAGEAREPRRPFGLGRGVLPALTAAALALTMTACGVLSDDKGSEKTNTSTSGSCADGDSTGVSDNEIVIGNTTPLTGQIGFIGQEANPVFDWVVKQYNDAGGYEGRKVKMISYDDAYDPSKALPAARRLIERDKIFAWAGGLGTPNFIAALPLLERAGIPSITPYAPAEDIGTMEHPLVYMTWPNFIAEYQTVASHLIEKEGMGSKGGVAFVHFDTDAGRDALNGTKKALADAGMELKKVISVSTDETDWASIAVDLRSAGVDWVGMQVAAPAGGQLIDAMAKLGFRPGTFAMSDYIDDSWAKDFGDVANGHFWAAMKVKPFDDPSVAATIKEIEDGTGKPVTVWAAVGYVQAKLLVAGLEGMKAPTRECLAESLSAVQNLEVGFLPPITFGDTVRQSTTPTGVMKLENGKFTVVVPFQ